MAEPIPRPSIVRETNFFLRTVVYGGIVGLLGLGTWEARDFLHKGDEALQEKTRELAELKDTHTKALAAKEAEAAELKKLHAEEKKKLEQEVARINTALRFLKLEHRVARLEILEQSPDPDKPTQMLTKIRFTELGPKGEEIGSPTIGTLKGTEIYIDAPTIRFKDDFVEQGDLLRGRSICRFRRIYGDGQAPTEGISLDRPPESPGDMTEFEKNLWNKFWDLANSPEHAEQLGVQSAQGGGPAVYAKKGTTYHVELRASGGLPNVKAVEQRPDPAATEKAPPPTK